MKNRFVKIWCVIIITAFVFCLGVKVGKIYTIKFQVIHKTEIGYCIELDNQEYEYIIEG